MLMLEVISALSKRLDLRQRVIATANVYCKRFYCKNAYAATDVMLVMAACVYLAAKVEEMPVRIRTFCTETSRLYVEMGLRDTTLQVETLAEMEFYLLEELEFDLVVFHPYRTLQKLAAMRGCAPDTADGASADGTTERSPPGYASAFARSIDDKVYQLAWYVCAMCSHADHRFIINDTYWTELPLLYPPYLIAIASLYLSLVLHPSTAQHVDEAVRKRKATEPPEPNAGSATQPDACDKDPAPPASMPDSTPENILAFLARLNVSLPLVAEIAQALLANYALWHRVRAGRTGSDRSNLVGA